MICHYEVLGLPLDCLDDDIKKTYRKLALLYHPDKNPENHEECTKKFLAIQQAYEVLIDPQERAWYDKHRNAILKGGLGRGEEYEDKSLDVYQYFNTGCYSGFDDGPKSFYTVYANVFKLISEEDVEYMEQKNILNLAPEFGNSESPYTEVVGMFYAYWESYSTLKTYVWAEKYDTRDAPNRQVRRIMEQDNKKLRDAARKERNEQIRTLVAFVKKRDKRVQVYNQKLRERAEEVNRLTVEMKEQKRLERLKTMEGYIETGWSATSELDDQLRNLELDIVKQFSEEEVYSLSSEDAANDGDEDVDVDEIQDNFCVACNKNFKSLKAMENHCNSKRHQEKIILLIREMRSEETGQNSEESDECDAVSDNLTCSNKSRSKKQKKKRRKLKNVNLEQEENDLKNEIEQDVKTEENVEHCNTVQSSPLIIDEKALKDINLKEINKTKNSEAICNTCKEKFETRNKLFDHLKSSGHALRVEPDATTLNKNINRKPKKKLKKQN